MSPNEPAQLMMMTEIDKEYIRKEAKSEKYKDKAKWFFSTLTNEQKENFKNNGIKLWKRTMEINIPMFTYFDIYATTNNINYPFMEIGMFQKDWNTISGKKLVSTHPPLEEVIIKVKNFEVIASPFKKINFKEDESRSANLKDLRYYCSSN